MKVCIHRGAKEIGGTCIELESQGQRIILDIGCPLDCGINEATIPEISGIHNYDKSLLGIIPFTFNELQNAMLEIISKPENMPKGDKLLSFHRKTKFTLKKDKFCFSMER